MFDDRVSETETLSESKDRKLTSLHHLKYGLLWKGHVFFTKMAWVTKSAILDYSICHSSTLSEQITQI